MSDFDNEFPDEHSHEPQEVDNGVYGLHVTDDEGRHYYMQVNLTGEGMILDLYDRYGEQNLATWAREWNEVGQMVYDQDPQNVVPQTSHPLFDEIMSILIARGVLTTDEARRLSRDQHIIDRFWESDIGPMVDDIQDQLAKEMWPEKQEYEVNVSCHFEATSVEDAVAQMAAWLQDSSHTAGYRVSVGNSTTFIDAELIDFDKVNDEW